MNPNTGEVVADIDALDEKAKKEFVPIPEDLRESAAAFLKGRESGFLDLKGGSPLAGWATMVRLKKEKNRVKNRMARASRKANRGTNRGR